MGDVTLERPDTGPGCSTPTDWPRPIRPATSRSRSPSMPSILWMTHRRSMATTMHWKCPAALPTSRAGHSRSCAPCRRYRRSPGLSASGVSAIGQWSGVPFLVFLERIGADLKARYVGFNCADRYYSSIDMATALHPQTILALDYGDAPLPTKYGFPMKLRVPTKLGFKSPSTSCALHNQRLPGRILGRSGLQLV